MATQIVSHAPVSTVPAKPFYWQGYDQFVECFFASDYLTPEEKRGYEAAQRHQADCETDDYLMRLNVNAYGDLTDY